VRRGKKGGEGEKDLRQVDARKNQGGQPLTSHGRMVESAKALRVGSTLKGFGKARKKRSALSRKFVKGSLSFLLFKKKKGVR